MYIYIYTRTYLCIRIYIHYTICNMQSTHYELWSYDQRPGSCRLSPSVPASAPLVFWCVAHSSDCSRVAKFSVTHSDSDGIWGPNVMREFPRNYIVLGIFTLGDARCENYTAVIFAETACVEWIWKIRSWRFTIHGWGSCTCWHCLLAVYGAQPGQMDTHGEFLWARLPLCLCPWKDHPSTTAEDSEVLI